MKRFFVLTAIIALSSISSAWGQAGPGWHHDAPDRNLDAARQLISDTSSSQSASTQSFAPLTLQGGGATQQSSSVGNEADEITPEIQELARGLLHDPVRIFAYCRNNIKYEHYFGSKKGATMTLLEGSGNGFDTSALMVALLRASGYTADYRYGPLDLYDYEVADWLGLWYFGDDGVPYPQYTDSEFRAWSGTQSDPRDTLTLRFLFHYILYNLDRGFPGVAPDYEGFFWYIPHVWVEFEADGQTYEADPSFKLLGSSSTAADLAVATGYNRTAFLNQASQGATTGTNYVKSLNETNLDTQLTQYTDNLLQWLKDNRPNGSVRTLLARRSHSKGTYDSLDDIPTVYYGTSLSWLPVTDWSVIPESWMTKLTITAGEYNYSTEQFTTTRYTRTINLPSLKGQKLSLGFSGNNGSFYLDDAILGSSFSVPNADIDIRLSVNHAHGNYDTSTGIFTDDGGHDQEEVKAYIKGNDHHYAILYGFTPSGRLLRKRQEILDGYIRDPLVSTTSREVVSEILNIMGLNWLLQTQYNGSIVATQFNANELNHHRFGRMAQEEGYYVDVGLQFSGIKAVDGDSNRAQTAFQLQSHFDSALEHSLIEQMQGSGNAAVSTIKILQLANAQGLRVYRATTSNWTSVRSHLSSKGYDSGTLDDIAAYLTSSDSAVLIPEEPDVALDQWSGTGYAVASISGLESLSGMLISGGYFGGYLSEPDYVDYDPIYDYGYSDPSYWDTGSSDLIYAYEPVTTPSYYGADPVDMASGAFVYDKVDLQLGQASPRGLTFSRHYNSNRRYDDSAGLGYGWTHNLDISITERSSIKAGLGETTQYQMAPYLAALTVAKDLYQTNANAKEWQTACLAVKWAADQLLNKAVSVSMGGQTIEFVQMPDGEYVPPAGITMTLTKNGQNHYVLTERSGNTYTFNGNNRIASISDQYNKTQTFTYSSGKLMTVTDAYGRALTLTWNGDRITRVADSTGRDVDFAYSGDNLVTATDADSHDWTFAYDAEHRIIELSDPKNQVIVENFYDARSRVYKQESEGDPNKTWNLYYSGFANIQEDPQGGRTTYFYDDRGRSISVENALGEGDGRSYDGQDQMIAYITPTIDFTFYDYDENNNLIETTDPLFNEASNTYDSEHRLQTATDFRGNSMSYTYNDKDQVLTITDAKNIVVQTNTYNSNGNLHTVTDAASNTTTYSYDSFGNVNRIDYPNGDFETFTYNARGDLLSHTSPRGFTTSYTYNNRRQLLVTAFPDATTMENTYDECGNLASEEDPKGNVTAYTYSPTRKLLTTMLPATDAGIAVITNTYDSRDWLASTTDPLNRTTTFTYDAAGRVIAVTNPLSESAQTEFDGDGRVSSRINPLNDDTDFGYDAKGNRTTLTDAHDEVVTYGYDENSNQTSILNRRGHTFTFAYDPNNRLLTSSTPSGRTTTQTWNDRGLLASIQEPSSQTTTFSYDSLGQMDTKSDPVGTTSYTFDESGNIETVSENGQTITRTYDNRDRITSYTDSQGNTVGYAYDDNGNLTTLTYPGNKVVTYTYNEWDQLETVTDWANRITTYEYDINGRLTKVVLPNGTSRHLSYDDADRVTRMEERKADDRLFSLHILEYDNAGKITNEFRAPTPDTLDLPAASATYDTDNRIATFNGLTLSYDLDGNMTSGPLLSDALVNYTFDSRNRLTGVDGHTYAYDAEGNRISSTYQGETTTYVVDTNAALSRTLMQTTPEGTTYYIYGTGLLYEVSEAEEIKTYHFDNRGSTVAIVADDGLDVTDRVEYSPYGMTTNREGNTDTPFLYNGQFGVMTDATGLLFMRARYYNPYLRRFINPDPIGFSGGLNWYAYADGNPISNLDPFGLWSWKSVAWNFTKGVVVGAAITAAIVVAAPVAVAGLTAVGLSAAAATATVTTGLGVAAVVGGVTTVVDTTIAVRSGDWDRVAYNVGGVVGGAVVGAAGGGRYIADNVSQTPSSVPPGRGLFGDQYMHYQSGKGSVFAWLATGPTPQSGGGAAAIIASGVMTGQNLITNGLPKKDSYQGGLK